jgi:hypothetical protein
MADQLVLQIVAGTILVLISAFFGTLGYLLVRTLSLIDRNQLELFSRLQKLEAAIVRINAHLSTHLDLNNRLDL